MTKKCAKPDKNTKVNAPAPPAAADCGKCGLDYCDCEVCDCEITVQVPPAKK